jgi:hypothetical protein
MNYSLCSNPIFCCPAVVSVILNIFFNGLGSVEAARSDATAVAATAEHV